MKRKSIFYSIGIIAGLILSFGLSAQTSSEDSLKSVVIDSKYGYTIGDSIICIENLSLYREYYDQWKKSNYKNEEMFNAAYPSWRKVCQHCPKASLNTYFRGSSLLKHKIKTATDDKIKNAYIDSLMILYDKRIEYFGDHPKYGKASALGFKAMDLYSLRNDNPVEYYPLFIEAYTVAGKNTSARVIQGYFNTSVKMAKIDSIAWSQVIYNYLDIKKVVEYNLNDPNISKKDSIKYSKAGQHLEQLMVAIATCENIQKIFTPEYLKDSSNVQLLQAIIRLSDIRGCTDNLLYFKAATSLHAVQPSPLSAFSLGKLNFKKEDYETAEVYLKEATETMSDSMADYKADALLIYAECLRKQNKLSDARTAARKVLEYRPNDGMSNIMVGDLYASSASSCKYKGLIVAYWAAYDEYAKAYNLSDDENVKETAKKKMAVMRNSFPPLSEVFMRNLKDGDSFKVDCWINQTTTVRGKPE